MTEELNYQTRREIASACMEGKGLHLVQESPDTAAILIKDLLWAVMRMAQIGDTLLQQATANCSKSEIIQTAHLLATQVQDAAGNIFNTAKTHN